MGAVVSSERFKDEYVSNKVEKWVQDIEQFSNIAKDEPQSALSSFTRAISHRWTMPCSLQRTMTCTGHLFQPLENVIREKVIPALVGRRVSDIERRILALPVRLGGIGLTVTLYYLLTVSILHQSALLEILPMSSTTETKILPTLTEYKLRITSNWSRHKKNGYCRMNTIF